MLNRITAALIATTLIAAPAFAQTSGNNAAPAAPAVQSQAVPVKTGQTANTDTQKPVKHAAKHSRKHVSKHASRSKMHATHQARHVKPTKTHQVNAGKPAGQAAKRS
jgi:hypothetical protein